MLKRIAVKDVRLGMFITELCGSWMEHPFWKTKFLLADDKDLNSIRDSGIKELWIDTDKGLDAEEAPAKTRADVERETEQMLQSSVKARLLDKTSMDNEVQAAKRICAKAKDAVIDMFNDARMGRAVEVEKAQSLVEEISASVFRQPHALISLARLKNADEYTYMHSVAVCALRIWCGKQAWLVCCTTWARWAFPSKSSTSPASLPMTNSG
jgi:HD-GYP domain-containing protein (c-di-GMP phosphodiesterase class II)